MAMSDDLYLAILSLDSYNREYGQGIRDVPDGDIGNATRGVTSALFGKNPDDTRVDATASFFAAAYALNGRTIIAYRGTDSILGDLPAFATGAGLPDTTQTELASQFYKVVNNGSINTNPNIILTGHSLGGGLAGFIGSAYGINSVTFDNMSFENAATKLAQGTEADAISNDFNARQYFYGDPALRAAPDFNLNRGYRVVGEALDLLLPARDVSRLTPLSIPGSGSLSVPLDRHSQALLTVLLYASDNNLTDWTGIGPEFLDALFNAAVAKSSRNTGPTGDGDSAGLITRIAYSAIDEGTRLFGDTGIRALFDDAGDLGRVLKGSDVSTTVKAAASALAEVLVQFAGQLAVGKVLQSGSPEALSGVISVAADGNSLAVDFAESLWSLGVGGPTTDIVGRKDLTDIVFRQADFSFDGTPPNDVRTGMKWLWNDDDSSVIDRFIFATKDGALTTTITDNDTVYGGAGQDVYVFGRSLGQHRRCHAARATPPLAPSRRAHWAASPAPRTQLAISSAHSGV